MSTDWDMSSCKIATKPSMAPIQRSYHHAPEEVKKLET
jgi:hypothetical protein